MMEREELGRRWREAQFHAMAKAAEQQPEQPAEPDPEPSVMLTIAQRAGLKTGLDPYTSPDDRLRRYAGLK
jgi:hypothetical protein